MRSLVQAAAAILLLAPAGALAQPVSEASGPDTYLELHAGAVFPQHDDVDRFDPGWSIGGTFGARFTRFLSAEGEVSYERWSADGSGVDGTFGPYRLTETLAVVPITASVRLSLPFRSAELSALAGVGLHVASWSSDVNVAGVSSPGSDTTASFGFHVGAGVGFNLSPTTLVGIDVRRTFVETKLNSQDVRIDGLRVAVKLAYHL